MSVSKGGQNENSVVRLALGLVVLSRCASGQWVQSNGPYGGYVSSFAVSGTDLFAGTFGGGVLVPTNNGTNWAAVNIGLTANYVNALVVLDTNLIAGTTGGHRDWIHSRQEIEYALIGQQARNFPGL